MALDFLGVLGGVAEGAGALGSLASSLGGLFGSKQKVPAAATEAMNLQSSLMRGLAGGNSPEFNNMMQAEQNNSRTQLLKAINEIVRQNRRAMTRGPAGVLINPDRRDEAIARALMGVYENEGDRARAAAKQTALGILGQAGGVANTALGLEKFGSDANLLNAGMRATGARAAGTGIQELLAGAGKLFGGGSNLSAGAPSGTINDSILQQRKAYSGGLY